MSDSDSDNELSSQARDIDEWEEEGTARIEDEKGNDDEEEDDEEEDDETQTKQRLVIGLDYGTTYTGIIH